jgi:hypothetical protein
MNAIYAGNFSVVENRVMLLLSACGETERRKDDEKDVVAEGYDREKESLLSLKKKEMLSEVIRVWTTRKARIYSSPSSMLAEERIRKVFRNACLSGKDEGPAIYVRARQGCVEGYRMREELENRQIRKKTVAVYMLVGV